jgi:hypothetical protein
LGGDYFFVRYLHYGGGWIDGRKNKGTVNKYYLID